MKTNRLFHWAPTVLALSLFLTAGNLAIAADKQIVPNLTATPTFTVSTVPSNGDQNPYGVVFVPRGFPEDGLLKAGDILVSNFNNIANTQGTGTTIVSISEDGTQSVFFQGQSGLGLTTALGVLKKGFVLVGNVPSPTGTCTGDNESGVEQGSLLIIDRYGNLVKTLTSPELLDGPWDLTINEDGENTQVFVSNVLSGTVTRLDLKIFEFFGERIIVERSTQIASGYIHQCNEAALVVGPTGLALDKEKDILYVASTGDNAIFAVKRARERTTDAGTGSIFIQDTTHLHGPLGLVRARNGDLITSQGDAINLDSNHPNEIVEYTSKGVFVAEFAIDPPPVVGAAFGIALVQWDDGFRFAAVDDSANNLDVWVVK
ncbi:MAG: hypothetical protein ABSF90_04890 [Syntrophobacteraceae bacterium]|jgi:hypothetical protein